MKDLVALVADKHIGTTLRVLLERRRRSLNLRPISFDVFPHEDSDPGVLRGAPEFLRRFLQTHRYALAVLDVEFSGSPGPRQRLEGEIQQRLDGRGWQGRSRVIAIDPELEAWVWSDSPHVPRILGLAQNEIRDIADEHDWWAQGAPKPIRPKELMSVVLRRARKVRSAAIYAQLAQRVSVQRCKDAAFAGLRDTLREWFGAA